MHIGTEKNSYSRLRLWPVLFMGIIMLLFGASAYGNENVAGSDFNRHLDSILNNHPFTRDLPVHNLVAPERAFNNKTDDFYWLLALVVFLGFIRYLYPWYIRGLWQGLLNFSVSGSQTSERMKVNSVPNLLTNILFVVSLGAYLYYVLIFLEGDKDILGLGIWAPLFMVLLVASAYLVKSASLKLTAWILQWEQPLEQYRYQIFFMNKVTGMVVLPFTLLLAFGHQNLKQPMLIVSVALIFILVLLRYLRSLSIFTHLFRHNRFHFFLYLCASELLPLVIIIKLFNDYVLGF